MTGFTYRDAGVDQEGADSLIPIFAALAAKTGEASDLGGFAGGVPLDPVKQMRRPRLVMSTDGVGTKVELLARYRRFETAGWDAVAMNVDDVVCVGAEPIALVDYISVERLDPEMVAGIVSGVADACVHSGAVLVGGETSQHPGLLPPDGFDVVATAIGLVEADEMWGPHLVREGDAIVGLRSSGPHSNGYSLIRRVFEGAEIDQEFLEPTAIYAQQMLTASREVEVHAAAHITGGGLPGNVSRVLPDGLSATVRPSSWELPGWCSRLLSEGVSSDELMNAFNCGIGMVMVTPEPSALMDVLARNGVDAVEIGEITPGSGVTFA